jgi:hypothetical protein
MYRLLLILQILFKKSFFGVEFSCLSYIRYFGVIFNFYRKDQAEASLYPSRPKKVSF